MANVAPVLRSGRAQLSRPHLPEPDVSLIPVAIIANREIGPGAKLVYSKLWNYAWANETATNNRLATDLGVSPRSIRNYVTALKTAGLVRVQLQPGKPSSYTLISI